MLGEGERLVHVGASVREEQRVNAERALEGLQVILTLDLRELGLDLLDAVNQIQILDNLLALPVGLARLHELLHVGQPALQSLALTDLELRQARLVPVGVEHRLAGPHLAELRRLERHALVLAVGHDVQERLERGHSHVRTAVGDVGLANALIGVGDGLEAISEDRLVLELRAEDVGVKDRRGVGEHTPEEVLHELLGDAVPEDVGRNRLAVNLHCFDFLQVAVLDQVLGRALLLAHARPHLRHQQRAIVVDLLVRADHTSRRDEDVIAGDGVRDERRIQVVHHVEHVERTLGQGTLRAGARGGRRLASHGRGHLHEELGQLVVVDRVVHTQRRDSSLGIGGIVAAAAQHRADRGVHRLAQRDHAREARPHGAEVEGARISDLHRVLEVAGVGRGLAVDETRVRRGHAELRGGALEECEEALLHGLGELLEADSVVDDRLDLLAGHRLEVGDEAARARHVLLRDLVVSAVDGLVRALEEAEFDVLGDFDGRQGRAEVKALDLLGGDHDGGGDVILRLELVAGEEVLAEGEGLPGEVAAGGLLERDVLVEGRAVADADVRREERGVAVLELVAERAVDGVGVEVTAPVSAPLGLVVLLDHGDELANVGGDRVDEGVVLIGVVGERREQLDDDAGRDARVKEGLDVADLDAGLIIGVLVLGGMCTCLVVHDGRVVLVEDLVELVEVALDVAAEDGAVLDHVLEALRDLRLASARHGGGLVEVSALTNSALEVPLLVDAALSAALGADGGGALLDHLDLVAGREHVRLAGGEVDALAAEGHSLLGHGKLGVLGHVKDVRVLLVDGIALVLELDGVAEELNNVLEGVRLLGLREVLVGLAEAANLAQASAIELLSEIERRVRDAASRMLLLRQTVHVGCIAQLGLDLLLAVAEVVVGNEGDGHTAGVAARQLESAALVVLVVLLLPEHAVLDLALGGVLLVG
mmetsp:Transcript_3513/g.8398  ORF Transcript_3513/g.8398 Transcript_3513/m.8398 type:complete len:938 (+) Transcript_3513:180-2993(+)